MSKNNNAAQEAVQAKLCPNKDPLRHVLLIWPRHLESKAKAQYDGAISIAAMILMPAWIPITVTKLAGV